MLLFICSFDGILKCFLKKMGRDIRQKKKSSVHCSLFIFVVPIIPLNFRKKQTKKNNTRLIRVEEMFFTEKRETKKNFGVRAHLLVRPGTIN